MYVCRQLLHHPAGRIRGFIPESRSFLTDCPPKITTSPRFLCLAPFVVFFLFYCFDVFVFFVLRYSSVFYRFLYTEGEPVFFRSFGLFHLQVQKGMETIILKKIATDVFHNGGCVAPHTPNV